MFVSIHQPDYLPWLGYFNKIKQADIFVLLGAAGYSRNGFHNRNKIKTPQGWSYLTIPISREYIFKPLNETKLPLDRSWTTKHLKAIENNYRRAPYWDQYGDFFKNLYEKKVDNFNTLAELNSYIIIWFSEQFGLNTKLVKDTDLPIDLNLKATNLLIAVNKAVGAKRYLSGPSGKKYLELKKFRAAGIEVEYQEYHEPEYKQMFGEYIKGLSAVDLLLNHGPASIKYL